MQGYKYEALISFNKLAGFIDAEERVFDSYLEDFQKKFIKDFFWPEENFFYLGIDGEGTTYNAVTSNAGHLLFTNFVSAEYKKMIVSRLFKADIWTPYGIRTHSTKNPDFNPFSYQLGSVWPFDNWVIAEGLRISGFQKEATLIKGALVLAFEELGHIPEYYAVTEENKIQTVSRANPLQAWSSAGLLNLLL